MKIYTLSLFVHAGRLATLFSMSVSLLGGCGGGLSNGPPTGGTNNGGVPTPDETNASMTVSVAFPEDAPGRVGTRAIPANTNRIVVRVRSAVVVGFPVTRTAAILIERPAAGGRATATINGLFPLIPLSVEAEARQVSSPGTGVVQNPTTAQLSEGTVLATGSTTVNLRPKQTTPVSVTLSPAVPPVVNPPFSGGGSVTVDPKDPTTIIVSLSALLSRANGEPLRGLTASNFEVSEDGINKQVVSATETGDGSATSRADIAFVIDASGSMSYEIAGVRNSVQAFAEFIASQRVDVRLAGVTFGDEVRLRNPFTSNYAAFATWVGNLSVQGGGDDPENAVDAIMTASNELSWRSGAQKLLVVITDASTHQKGDGSGIGNFTTTEVVNSLKNRGFVLHSVSPGGVASTLRDSLQASRSSSNLPTAETSLVRPSQLSNPDVAIMTTPTGGRAFLIPSDGDIDLSALPLARIVLSGYTIKFKSVPSNRSHAIRLLVKSSGRYVAEQTFSARY